MCVQIITKHFMYASPLYTIKALKYNIIQIVSTNFLFRIFLVLDVFQILQRDARYRFH